MKSVDSWDFNVWEYSDAELPQVALELFKPYSVDRGAADRFIHALQKKYHDNPYHNFRHAIDVAQFVYKLDREGVLNGKLDPTERLALLLAAFGHDVGHPGKNNAFQKQFQTPIFKKYGAVSTLEKYHIDQLMHLLKNPEIGLDIPTAQMEKFITKVILATDIAFHEELLEKFKKGRGDPHILPLLIIKCADLTQFIRNKHISDRWAIALYEELLLQRKEEQMLGLDDHKGEADFIESLVKFQTIFMKKFAIPLFEEFFIAFPSLKSLNKTLMGHLPNK